MGKDDVVSRFDLTSPTDFRYEVEELKPYLSEEAFVRYKSKVEAALAQVLAERRVIKTEYADEIVKASQEVTAAEVYAEEEKTRHDIIAQVNMIKKRVSDGAKTAVHRTATSYDIVDTANAWRYKDAFNNVIIPDMAALEKEFIRMARDGKDVLQIGRTHLQHAEPITFGFAMAWYVSRFGRRIVDVVKTANSLEGKFSGAVGAYNASALFVDDPEQFEADVLNKCNMNPTEVSTQIVQPEPQADLVHYTMTSFGILANWADDMRNLMRPEIGEVGQPRGKDISASSTMPHKRNPIGLENIESLWKQTWPVMNTVYQDLISNHQRDLTNSASQRFLPVAFTNFDFSVRRATRVAQSLKPHAGNMKENFDMSKDKIIAEPLQLLLASYGHPDSHKYVGDMADESVKTGIPLTEMVAADPSLKPFLDQFTPQQRQIISDPTKYLGVASKKAQEVADVWEVNLKAAGLW